MASTINADNGVVSGTSGLKSTADTSGVLALQSNGSTALSIGTNLNVTLTNPLPVASGGTGATSLSGITVGTATNATNATTSTNLAGGSNGTIPYQSASGTTQMLAAGTSGQVLTSNGAAAPTWATPAPGAGTVTATASGSLTAGNPVVINSNGTVSAISGSYGTTPTFSGNTVVTGASNINYIAAQAFVYDTVNQKVVGFYLDSTNYPTAVVGTVSSSGTMTWGTPVVMLSNSASWLNAVYHVASGKIVAVFNSPGAGGGYAVVGTVSGTTITFGSFVVFEGGSQALYNAIAYDSVNQKVVVAYRAPSIFDYGYAVVGTVSGTTISFGVPRINFSSNPTIYVGATYDVSSGKIVLAYRDNSSAQVKAIVGTVSGTTISFGSEAVVYSNSASYIQVVYDGGSQKCVVAWTNSSSGYGQAAVGTVSGTSISFGSATDFYTNGSSFISCAYHSGAQKVAIAFRDISNYGNLVIGSVSGTSISFGTIVTFNAGTSAWTSVTYDSANGYLPVFYGQYTSTYVASGNVGALSLSTNLTSSNFLGFSAASYSNGQTATVNTVGSADASQSGLTVATKYYASPIGGLSTSAGLYAAYAGLAVSATKIIVKG